ncbi:hypothetical protein KP77_22880 [Jeotgalibacillus alimentarius]|uniref:Uncharacterized protein n=1 Tax=Jeotgalibacillus alimentarius TaxID=135826 RepID=A0A0C2VW54_9BACL|nr:hypothetical protein KP77_22880 [Jeotgalibacillus alimentarius]
MATTQLETANVNAEKQQVDKDNQQPSSLKGEGSTTIETTLMRKEVE